MRESQINWLNVFLMGVSALLAVVFPFELFLFSFVFMAPLHYLTEISWLEKKQFFIQSKSQIILLIVGTLIISSHHFVHFAFWNDVVNVGIFGLVALAFSLQWTKDWKKHVLTGLGAVTLVLAMHWQQKEAYLVIFTVFLPTIIHITLFTFLFMSSGVKKKNTRSGAVSLVFFLACSFFYFVFPLDQWAQPVQPKAKELYFDFIVLNKKISDFFGFGQINQLDDIYYSKTGIAIMQYIAFSYTYHFLNWFSKTSVIKWHLVDKKILVSLFLAYAFILGVIFIQFSWGMMILSVLGLAHMFLELPLNFQSIKLLTKGSPESK